MIGGHQNIRTVLKGCDIRKVWNHCTKGTLIILPITQDCQKLILAWSVYNSKGTNSLVTAEFESNRVKCITHNNLEVSLVGFWKRNLIQNTICHSERLNDICSAVCSLVGNNKKSNINITTSNPTSLVMKLWHLDIIRHDLFNNLELFQKG